MAETQKERTRARILDEAAKAMREHGFDGIGVAALMKRAGLTHGGFYAHFADRDDLVAHTVDRMVQDSERMLARHLAEADPRAGLTALIDYYLSDETRRRVDRGCPLPGLSGEAGRMAATIRTPFAGGVASFRAALAKALAALGVDEAEATAASMLSEMVGAMALARAVDHDAAVSETLRASRAQLKRRLGL